MTLLQLKLQRSTLQQTNILTLSLRNLLVQKALQLLLLLVEVQLMQLEHLRIWVD
ncbi:Uncharacterised protein [Mycobacteroides abscessus subsp. abscessus]|nr:Uncharacterised protein [Mycobacteroides abscessus subsp. abscessus]